jgi:hypothetical protein
MSRFIDKLKQALEGGPPMGFRAVAVPSKPRMLLVAALAQADSGRLADIAGADAGLLAIADLATGAEAIEQVSQAVPDIPWGGWLKEAGREGVGELGADFVVFTAEAPLFAEEKTGKVLEVEPSLEPALLKTVDDLPLDAVLIAAEKERLTWGDLMLFQRCASILNKPLLVAVPQEVTASELGTLWEAGVRGVVIKAGTEGKIAEIRQMLEKLPPSAGGRKKAGPLLPRMGGETEVEEEE